MYPDVTAAVATQTQDDLIHRADAARQAHLARCSAAPRGTRSVRRHHAPRLGGRLRHWLAAGYL